MPDRRQFLTSLGGAAIGSALAFRPAPSGSGKPRTDPPNVFFLSIDDINDWIGVYGGHPQAYTPNLDALAQRSTMFTKAYCSVPLCHPSRIATMTGIRPHNSGVYVAQVGWQEQIPGAVHLADHFRQHGYETLAGGKVYHHTDRFGPPGETWLWDQQLVPPRLEHNPNIDGSLNGIPAVRGFDWGTPQVPIEEYGDEKVVAWCLDRLNEPRTKPFFFAAGIFKPHLPWYAPQEFFDRFPVEDVILPTIIEDDLVDVPRIGRNFVDRYTRTEHIAEHGIWDDAVAAYLATISYADDLVGRLLAGLAASPYADNTIVVVWSDHGFHLGEKLHWEKNALWEEATRIPLFIQVPPSLGGSGIAPGRGQASGRTVELVDLFPTLTDLCGLPTPEQCDGRSLAPLLANPEAEWDRPAVSTWMYKNHSLRTERYRFIQYRDGTEELYDHEVDPLEWTNVAGDPAYAAVRDALVARLPQTNRPVDIDPDLDPETGENLSLKSYPNPSAGPVNIEFVLREPTEVSVTIFSMLGREVRQLADGRSFAPGVRSIPWDGTDDTGARLPGGMYLCVVRTLETHETRRIVLLP